ncbi:ABC transporter substrate-binding protein [Acidimicrobiia bacterium EGI L10123]|uniref:ABC transporter substrate-binding protein n=1 Tax=Salinilacustrithrix flava TaxID=2957203 RepID=UPI003D7C3394|nr:ABC transporter substrate-binding protein [Acidimicrobiia bacterium EGI L10123]
MRSPIRTRLAAVLAALALVLAACGDDDTGIAASGDPADTDAAEDTTEAAEGAEDGAGEATFPVTVTVDGTDTTIEAEPQAIVSLSPTATEMLFAVGAGEQVVAVDDFSNFPDDAPVTDLSGFDPNVEAIIGYDPDLVILSGDRNDVVAGLAAVDVPTIVLPSAMTIEDTYTQIEVVGAATGHVGDAAEVVANMQTDIEELVAQLPEQGEPLTYYHELDDTLYSVTSDTFIGEIYGLAGLENVADSADGAADAGGYPQLSAEFLIDADPDLIFLADTKCCGQDASTVAERPGWSEMNAVQQGDVVELDDDIASRWGPRIVDFLAAIVEATADVDAGVAG